MTHQNPQWSNVGTFLCVHWITDCIWKTVSHSQSNNYIALCAEIRNQPYSRGHYAASVHHCEHKHSLQPWIWRGFDKVTHFNTSRFGFLSGDDGASSFIRLEFCTVGMNFSNQMIKWVTFPRARGASSLVHSGMLKLRLLQLGTSGLSSEKKHSSCSCLSSQFEWICLVVHFHWHQLWGCLCAL